MKDTIKATLCADHTLECDHDIIGREGEGDILDFEIYITETLRECTIYLDFKKPNGESFRTPELIVQDGVAVYTVAPYLLTDKGVIEVQAVVINDNGDTWKSYVKKCYNLYSINSENVGIPEKEDFMAEARKMLEELIQTKQVTPRIGYISILASKWVGTASPYSQVVAVDGVTENSQVDLTPSVEQLAAFHEKDLAFVTENEDGVVTVYAIGQKPTNDYTIQVTITEVEV